jgi:hypothetical protein
MLVFLLPSTHRGSLFAPLLIIFADEFLMLLSTSDSSYDVSTALGRSLQVSDLKNYHARYCMCQGEPVDGMSRILEDPSTHIPDPRV